MNHKGFTLVEMLITMTLVVFLVGSGVAVTMKNITLQKANSAQGRLVSVLGQARSAAQAGRVDKSTCPIGTSVFNGWSLTVAASGTRYVISGVCTLPAVGTVLTFGSVSVNLPSGIAISPIPSPIMFKPLGAGTDIGTTSTILLSGWGTTRGVTVTNTGQITTDPTPTPLPTAVPTTTPTPTPGSILPWVAADIGTVGSAGNTMLSGGVFTVSAAGTDIWGTSDQFRYVYQPIVGDATIIARVESVSNTNSWTKTGVMMRESLGTNSTNAMMRVTPGSNASGMQYRLTTGASSSSIISAPLAPLWVKVTRLGNSFSGYWSNDGSAWTLVSSVTINMASSTYAGLVLTSHDNVQLATATLSNVSLAVVPTPTTITAPTPTGIAIAVVNPGFETGDLTGWKSAGTTVASSPVHAGTKSASVVGGNYVSQNVKTLLTTEVPYTFTMYSRVTAAATAPDNWGSPRLRVSQYPDLGTNTYGEAIAPAGVSSTWTMLQVTHTFTAAELAGNVYVGIKNFGFDGTVAVDDLSIQ